VRAIGKRWYSGGNSSSSPLCVGPRRLRREGWCLANTGASEVLSGIPTLRAENAVPVKLVEKLKVSVKRKKKPCRDLKAIRYSTTG